MIPAVADVWAPVRKPNTISQGTSAIPHTFPQLYFHFVWGPHSRYPAIDRVWRTQLLNILNEEVKKRGGILLLQKALPEHVHLLVRWPPALTPATFNEQAMSRQ